VHGWGLHRWERPDRRVGAIAQRSQPKVISIRVIAASLLGSDSLTPPVSFPTIPYFVPDHCLGALLRVNTLPLAQKHTKPFVWIRPHFNWGEEATLKLLC